MGFYRGVRFTIEPDTKQNKRFRRLVTIYKDGKIITFDCLNCVYSTAVRQAKLRIDSHYDGEGEVAE